MRVQIDEYDHQVNITVSPEDKGDVLKLLRLVRRMKNEPPMISLSEADGDMTIEMRKRHDLRWNANLIEAGRRR